MVSLSVYECVSEDSKFLEEKALVFLNSQHVALCLAHSSSLSINSIIFSPLQLCEVTQKDLKTNVVIKSYPAPLLENRMG